MPACTLSYEARRRIFLTANGFFLTLGCASLTVGVWLYLEKNDFLELTPTSFSAQSAAGLCAFSGAAIAIIAVVGCIGVSMNGRCLMYTYICFIVLLALVQCVTGLTGLFYKDSTREKIRSDLFSNINRTIAQTRAGRLVHLKISWDHLHESLKCCGVDGPSDWFRTVQWPQNEYVPDSCCDPSFFADGKGRYNCGKVSTTREHWFKQGCYEVFADWLYHHVHVVSVLSLILVFAETIVLLFAVLLACECKRRSRSRSSSSYHYTKGVGGNDDQVRPGNSS